MSKCEHGIRKTYCKECGGGGLCEHDTPRHYCKECGGKCLCVHGKRKYRCKECGGSEICEHDKNKFDCPDCKGSNRCIPHNKLKRNCRECNGTLFCIHGNRKARCKECGGSEICEHNISKYYCKSCKGSVFCIHGKQTRYCKDGCGGSGLCEHNHRKDQCVECGGLNLCSHGKRKCRCIYCGGNQLCKSSWCETRGNTNYEGYCVPCFVNNPENQNKPLMRNYKTKEKDVVDRITQTFINFTWIADKTVQYGCSRRRPDLLLDMGSHVIIVEIDENKHNNYDCICENKRLMELSQDLQHRPIVFIRFNPDDYTNVDGILVKSCWKLNKLGVMQITKTKQTEWDERIESLKQQIQYWMDNPTEKTIETIELFY
jgi:hypothetical protein